MNEQHEALYDAITGIDAEYIEESTRPPRQTRNRILRFAAAAAVLALLLSHERQACKKWRQYEHQGFTHHLRVFSYQPLRSKSQSLNSGSIMI